MKILKEGDRGVALAPGRGQVEIEYRYRDLELDSGVVVSHVLVGVDPATDEVLVVPAQSTPRIRESRDAAKDETLEVRLPRELEDVLGLIAQHFGAAPAKLSPAIVRFYLSEAAREPRLARRLERLSRTALASARRPAPFKLRCRRDLAEALDRMSRDGAGATRSDLIRGAIVAAKEDVLDGHARRRALTLRAVAGAV